METFDTVPDGVINMEDFYEDGAYDEGRFINAVGESDFGMTNRPAYLRIMEPNGRLAYNKQVNFGDPNWREGVMLELESDAPPLELELNKSDAKIYIEMLNGAKYMLRRPIESPKKYLMGKNAMIEEELSFMDMAEVEGDPFDGDLRGDFEAAAVATNALLGCRVCGLGKRKVSQEDVESIIDFRNEMNAMREEPLSPMGAVDMAIQLGSRIAGWHSKNKGIMSRKKMEELYQRERSFIQGYRPRYFPYSGWTPFWNPWMYYWGRRPRVYPRRRRRRRRLGSAHRAKIKNEDLEEHRARFNHDHPKAAEEVMKHAAALVAGVHMPDRFLEVDGPDIRLPEEHKEDGLTPWLVLNKGL